MCHFLHSDVAEGAGIHINTIINTGPFRIRQVSNQPSFPNLMLFRDYPKVVDMDIWGCFFWEGPSIFPCSTSCLRYWSITSWFIIADCIFLDTEVYTASGLTTNLNPFWVALIMYSAKSLSGCRVRRCHALTLRGEQFTELICGSMVLLLACFHCSSIFKCSKYLYLPSGPAYRKYTPLPWCRLRNYLF